MPFISIDVNFDEVMRNIDGVINGLPEMGQGALNESADLFVNTAKQKAHVITGRTQASIRKVSVTAMMATIQADWGAKWEEIRGGLHALFTLTADAISTQISDIIIRRYRL